MSILFFFFWSPTRHWIASAGGGGGGGGGECVCVWGGGGGLWLLLLLLMSLKIFKARHILLRAPARLDSPDPPGNSVSQALGTLEDFLTKFMGFTVSSQNNSWALSSLTSHDPVRKEGVLQINVVVFFLSFYILCDHRKTTLSVSLSLSLFVCLSLSYSPSKYPGLTCFLPQLSVHALLPQRSKLPLKTISSFYTFHQVRIIAFDQHKVLVTRKSTPWPCCKLHLNGL